MKTLITILFLFALTSYGQQTTIKWTDGNQSRTETFDLNYGRYDKEVTEPFKLAILHEGEYLTGNKALKILKAEGFLDELPAYTPQVKKRISVSTFPWFGIDSLPSTDQPNGYECKTIYGYTIQGANLESLSMWEMLGVVEWRPWNPGRHRIFIIDNPLWEPTEAVRAQQRELYTEIISERFVQMGSYIFPTLKAGADHWYWNGQEIEVTDHYLASKAGGYVKYLKPLKWEDWKPWEGFASASIVYEGENRLRKLLNLKLK